MYYLNKKKTWNTFLTNKGSAVKYIHFEYKFWILKILSVEYLLLFFEPFIIKF